MKQSESWIGCAALVLVAIGTSMAAWGQEPSQSPLPVLTGPYAVGRTQFAWTDSSRADKDEPSGHRELVVWIWYPASPNEGAGPAHWMPGTWAESFWSSIVKRDSVLEDANKKNPVGSIRTHAYDDAPIASAMKTYPVLLFEPGAGEVPLTYASLIEDLVSHGYVVAGVVPTGYTRFTVFPNGRVDLIDKLTPTFPPGSDKKTSDDQKPYPINGGKTVYYLTPEQTKALQEEFAKRIREGFTACTEDMTFTLDQMEELNGHAKGPFKGRLDLKHVGAFGHSLGGAASLQAAKDDARVNAAVDLDGRLFGTSAEGGVLKPLLLITEMSNPVFNASSSTGKPEYHVILAGSKHFFSADWGFMSFVPQSAKAERVGVIDPARALAITKSYVEAFFDEYLKGTRTDLLNGPSTAYPEITFETVK